MNGVAAVPLVANWVWGLVSFVVTFLLLFGLAGGYTMWIEWRIKQVDQGNDRDHSPG